MQAASSGVPAMPAAPMPNAFSSERRSEGSELILAAIYSFWFMDNTPPDNTLPDTVWGAEPTPSPMMDPWRYLRQGWWGRRGLPTARTKSTSEHR